MRAPSRLSLFGWSSGPFPVPVETEAAVARSRGPGRPSGRRGQRLALDRGEHGRRLWFAETIGGTPRAWRASVCSFLAFTALCVVLPDPALAQCVPRIGVGSGAAIDIAVREASVRFELPERWIFAVMRAESGGRRDAVSPKGAMGLLQLMPATWREVSAELGLGGDPFDVRANILAGSAYLRKLHDRFGAPGAFGAYNAGPDRYARYLLGRASLPPETRLYMGRVAQLLGPSGLEASGCAPPITWREAGMFPAPTEFARPADGQGDVAIRAGLWP